MKKIILKIRKKLMRSSGNDINYITMQKMLQSNPNILVIDVRTKDEYLDNHLKGAINIPMQEVTEKIEKIVPNKERVIILYCEYGGRSKKALNKLQKLGYINVYNLDGGIEAI